MFEKVIGRGEKNFLRAVPLSVAMDSHCLDYSAVLGRFKP
jgi:hypothetical protein